jgi:hypothetical protein
MAARSVDCTLVNKTGEALSFSSADASLDHGIFSPGREPPPKCDASAAWAGESDGFMTGTEGKVTYRGPSGAVTLQWNNPFVGGNDYGASALGEYYIEHFTGPKVGSNVSATYVVNRKAKPAPPPPAAPAEPAPAEPEPAPPPAKAVAETPEEPGRGSQVPKVDGQLTIISPKDWLVDIAWQAVNNIEWNPLILEITENRHGSQSGAICPGKLPGFPDVKEGGECKRPHEAHERARDARKKEYDKKVEELMPKMGQKDAEAAALKQFPPITNDFYSWCGDFVSWVFWKAWVLRGKPEDKVKKAELGSFLNREALNGAWRPGENLSMVEAYAKGLTLVELKAGAAVKAHGGLLVWHKPGDGYVPKPGDIFMANRAGGGHISIVASYEPAPEPSPPKKKGHDRFLTIDGKSFDEGEGDGKSGWIHAASEGRIKFPKGKAQGVAQNKRTTSQNEKDQLRGFIDTSKLREVLGYR